MISDNLPTPENFEETSGEELQSEETIDESAAEIEEPAPEELPEQVEQEEEQSAAVEETEDEAVEQEQAEVEIEPAEQAEDESDSEEQEDVEANETTSEEVDDSVESEEEAEESVTETEEEAVDSEEDMEEEPSEPEEEGEPVRENLHWYVVKVQSGREDSIKEAIERRVKIDGLEEYFGQVYVPTEEVVEMRRGKRVTRVAKKLPGYIMAQVEFNDEILYLFRETSGVGDFVGGSLERPPTPMTPQEIRHWMGDDVVIEGEDAAEESASAKVQKDNIPYSTGDRVKVKTGMFNGMEGEITDIDYEKGTIHVEVTIFGRGVDAELEHWNVEPVS